MLSSTGFAECKAGGLMPVFHDEATAGRLRIRGRASDLQGVCGKRREQMLPN